MDDPMMEDSKMQDHGTEDPETPEPGENEAETPGSGDPDSPPDQDDSQEEEPGEEAPGINLDEIVRRFGALLALTQDEAEGQRELCAAALGRMEEERSLLPGGEDPLMDYAAALAGHRFVLRCLARGLTVSIGDPRSGPEGARSAAKELEEDYRAAASRWLRPKGWCFRRTPPAGTGGCLWTR